MPKLAVIGTLDIAPERLNELLPLMMAHRARCLANEPGTLQFDVLAPHNNSSKVMLYEVYADEAAFQAHWNGASMARAREECAGMILNITGDRCTLVEQE